jgi:ABC-type branched-subunit amino acid transport system ATPase component
LDVSGLTVAYGGVVACDNLSLSVAQGQLVGLIGPNGAGKTSLIDAISGFASIRDGSSIVLGGENIEKLRPHDRYLRGMARTFQAAELFDELSVFENLLVTADRPRWNDPLRDLVTTSSDEALGTARFALEAVGLQHKAEAKASELSMGDRKLAAVARALAGRPRILLLDEPAAGLDTDESRVLGQLLQKIVASGASILLIDHDINLVFDICDWIYVLDFGCVIASGEPEAVRADEAVIDAYLGRAANDASAEFAEQPMDLL